MKKHADQGKLLLVAGLAGSGKSTVLNALEDFGFYTLKNLPLSLLGLYFEHSDPLTKNLQQPLAIGVDLYPDHSIEAFDLLLTRLKKKFKKVHFLFLTTHSEVLLRRFSETRRPHPFNQRFSLETSIEEEKNILTPFLKRADWHLDTSLLTPHLLKASLKTLLNKNKLLKIESTFHVSLFSFGFRHGLPLQSDLVFDVRFIANPYFELGLKHLTGLDPQVQKFILNQKEAKNFISYLKKMLHFLLPLYQKEGKSYLTLSFGCTGGKHRSVTFAEYFRHDLEKQGVWVSTEHRDLNKK